MTASLKAIDGSADLPALMNNLAVQARAAEHHCGDGGELVKLAGRRLSRLQASGKHHAGKSSKSTAPDIG